MIRVVVHTERRKTPHSCGSLFFSLLFVGYCFFLLARISS
jgi:cbb3-type cytochrome oxidase subunit 3